MSRTMLSLTWKARQKDKGHKEPNVDRKRNSHSRQFNNDNSVHSCPFDASVSKGELSSLPSPITNLKHVRTCYTTPFTVVGNFAPLLMQLQAFPQFGKLPPDIRTMIWQEASKISGPRRIVVVIRAANPKYVPHPARRTGSRGFRALAGPHAYIRWTWTCYATTGRFGPPGFVGMLGATRESRGEYLRLNPQFLRLENGPVIHFEAARDSIFMDAKSLFALHMYTIVPDHLIPVPKWVANLHGFNQIQNLRTSLRHSNMAGLTPEKGLFGDRAVLAGVKFPIREWHPSPMALMEIVNDYRPLGVWHWLNDEKQAMLASHRAPSQTMVINRYFDQAVPGMGGLGLQDEVDRFFKEQQTKCQSSEPDSEE
ncbi:hypothetical protein BKA64DRAFT_723883 [Cadophora sp. MPI-SDFR-AT-0126]|nr:hypothetical protein BKA64DRAFT_723883 [Leotiomycetes sp. MPI-SDFR-AT-0126]